MKAVILAAGKGERMKPLTNTRPKVMLPITGKPMVEHTICEALKAGIKEFVIVIGYHGDVIKDYFKDGGKWGITIEYVAQQKQLGTADAIMKAKEKLGGKFLMLNGDCIVSAPDIKKLIRAESDTMGITERSDVSGYGVVCVNGDKITSIDEKTKNPKSNLINTGAYLFTTGIFEAIEKTQASIRGELEITSSLGEMIKSGKDVFAARLDSFVDVSYPWNILDVNEMIMKDVPENCEGAIENGAVIKGSVAVGKGTIIRSGSYLQGPIIIGENSVIGPNCYIRPCTAIGNNCHVGASCEVKNTVVMDGTKIPHHNYVGDSVIGANCNLGAGTKIANLRLDEENIKINGVDTKRRKLGAIIGDDVKTGINSCINAGAMIGNSSRISPNTTVKGVLEPNTVVL